VHMMIQVLLEETTPLLNVQISQSTKIPMIMCKQSPRATAHSQLAGHYR